jgi:mono/diheme cytochrome c family protein
LIRNSPWAAGRAGRSATAAAIAGMFVAMAIATWFTAAAADETPAGSGSGAAIFSTRCAVCHGPEAAGIPGSFPSLHEQVVAFGKSPEGRAYLVMVVTTGLMGELKVAGITYRGVMPAQSGLSDADIAAVLSYLAANRGKDAGPPALGAADVAAIHAAHPDHAAQSTLALRPAFGSP